MTVLTIRAHKRYATRQKVRLRGKDARPVEGLLIELSSEGGRISNLGSARFEIGQEVTLEIDGVAYAGHIRWSRDGLAGVRLVTALYGHEVAGLLATTRANEPERRYGT